MKKSNTGPKKPKFEKRNCRVCGTEFQAVRQWHWYCSPKCRVADWQRRNTDPSKIVALEGRIEAIEKKLGIYKEKT
jgi:hypothetical protein